MNEYIEEAEDVSFEGGIGESYDHEQANKELYIREGIEQGSISTKQEIAKSLLHDNVDIKKVAMYTGLSSEELEKIKKSS